MKIKFDSLTSCIKEGLWEIQLELYLHIDKLLRQHDVRIMSKLRNYSVA